jgi:hypothetical protein
MSNDIKIIAPNEENADASRDSLNENNSPNSNNFNDNEKLYFFKCGNATTESKFEYSLFQYYLKLGISRSLGMVFDFVNNSSGNLDGLTVPSKISVSFHKLKTIYKRNNWGERAKAYDFDNYNKDLIEAEKQREVEHREKLEEYRAKQEYIGAIASRNAAILLKMTNDKLVQMISSGETLRLEDLNSLGALAAKLADVGRNISSEALAVDQLLEVLESDEEDEE